MALGLGRFADALPSVLRLPGLGLDDAGPLVRKEHAQGVDLLMGMHGDPRRDPQAPFGDQATARLTGGW